MAVINILKDGSIKSDLTDYVVKEKDMPNIYLLINQMNKHIKPCNVCSGGN